MKRMNVTALAAAMGICAPALSQSVDCRGDARAEKTKSLAEQCAGKSGEARRACTARVDNVYLRAIERCATQEQRLADQIQRNRERAAAQAERDRQRAEAARQRAQQRQR